MPKKGAGPRLDVDRAARRMGRQPHRLLAYQGGDGMPVIVPFSIDGASADGMHLRAAPGLIPPDGRRAG